MAADGGVFSYGGARYFGSTGGSPLAAPIVGMAQTSNGSGYELVSADGGVYTYGSAPFLGSMGGRPLHMPVVALVGT